MYRFEVEIYASRRGGGSIMRELLLKVEEAEGKPGWKALAAGMSDE